MLPTRKAFLLTVPATFLWHLARERNPGSRTSSRNAAGAFRARAAKNPRLRAEAASDDARSSGGLLGHPRLVVLGSIHQHRVEDFLSLIDPFDGNTRSIAAG